MICSLGFLSSCGSPVCEKPILSEDKQVHASWLEIRPRTEDGEVDQDEVEDEDEEEMSNSVSLPFSF